MTKYFNSIITGIRHNYCHLILDDETFLPKSGTCGLYCVHTYQIINIILLNNF